MPDDDPYRSQAIDGKGPLTRRAKMRANLSDWGARNSTALGFGIGVLLLGGNTHRRVYVQG